MILYWVCPIAIDIQEDGNEYQSDDISHFHPNSIVSDELSVIIELNYFANDRFMLEHIKDTLLQEYHINPDNVFFTGPKAVYLHQKYNTMNLLSNDFGLKTDKNTLKALKIARSLWKFLKT